jgi:hypothetical protein
LKTLNLKSLNLKTDAIQNTTVAGECETNVPGRNLKVRRLQGDEIWQFVGSKARNTSPEKKAIGWGDVWTWTALDADTKLCVSYLVGDAVWDGQKSLWKMAHRNLADPLPPGRFGRSRNHIGPAVKTVSRPSRPAR